jgi:DNA-binding MarR family transcriptional regulator
MKEMRVDASGGRERRGIVTEGLLQVAKARKKKTAGRAKAAKPREHISLYASMPLWARPGFLIRRLHQINYALFFEECAGFEITPVQYSLLTTLSLNPDTDQHTLGREVGIDRTNVADVLRRLEQRGLVTRRKGEKDRRAVLARLTPTGEKVTREMFKAMQRAQARLLEPLPAKERAALMAALLRLVDANNHLGRTVFQPS